MSDQSTRARTPEADPRQPFTLGQEDAQALFAAAQLGLDATNAWWLEAGQRLGFVWTTVQELHWAARPRDDAGETQAEDVNGATFTAWPEKPAVPDFTDALAWLAAYDPQDGKGGPIGETDGCEEFTRDVVLAAFNAGSDHGFAMGVATQPQVGLGWDGMELLRDSAELFRFYESSHLAKLERLLLGGGRDPDTEAAVDDARRKVRRNAEQAEKLEAFLADPSQSHLVHDGLREARGDAALGVMVGWEAALIEVRNLVESGRAFAGSAIPPLVLLSRLEELEAPEDMDEMLGPWRGVMHAISRIAELRGPKPAWVMEIAGGGWSNADHLRWAAEAVVAWRTYHDKAQWVREAIRLNVPKDLGMPSQLGRHAMDTARDLVARLNELLEDATEGMVIATSDPSATVRTIEAAADAGLFKAQGINSAEELRERARDPGAAGLAMSAEGQRPPQGVPGVYSEDQGSTRYPAAEGLECMGKPEGEA